MYKLNIYRRKTLIPSQRWGWRLVAPNGRKVANSGEGYLSKAFAQEIAVAIINPVTVPYEVSYS